MSREPNLIRLKELASDVQTAELEVAKRTLRLHEAIRRSSASLSEVGRAVGLSKQRVHQIRAAGR